MTYYVIHTAECSQSKERISTENLKELYEWKNSIPLSKFEYVGYRNQVVQIEKDGESFDIYVQDGLLMESLRKHRFIKSENGFVCSHCDFGDVTLERQGDDWIANNHKLPQDSLLFRVANIISGM